GHLGERQDQAGTRAMAQGPAVVEAALRAAVSERLGNARFGLWFGDGVRLGLSGDGDSLEVRVPDPFFREWIRSHYTASLIEAAEAVVGRRLQISIQIHGETEPPLGDVVAPGPTRTEPDLEPRRSGSITIPLPGNPQAPLSFPSPTPKGPGPSSPPGACLFPQSDQPQPPRRMQTTSPVSPSSSVGSTRRPLRRLEDFVTGPGNRLAHAAAREMAQSAGVVFNPLVIYSAVGLGKTHLLEGISHTLKQVHPTLQIVQLTAEAFTNSFLESMRTGTLNGFRTRYRSAGGLVVDDVHFLAAKRATMVEFLHTFNALIDKGAPIVLAADQHPRLISRMTEELVTRFLGGMVVKIEPPDLATRRAILQTRAAARGVNVPETVVTYIAEHLRASIRELEGALHSVIAQAVLTGRRLDLNVAKTALRDTIRHTAQAVALRDVERTVCQLFQVDAEVLKSDSRARTVAYPRMMAMYLARKHTGAAYSEIGRYFGGRNHSTVISAEKKVQGWLHAEERTALLPGFETVADLLADLEQTLGA
ncbi:MAG TPA: chromosomal replication initiator protein DnaA, partial [Isosphaeraceae bacterium]|nr:chromosomal replication initiator protein DnaA [Isosphaeraceae bacterium]